jgi:hypothetical protein
MMTEASHGGWYYQQVDLGFNYRMTELQAALGVTQMQRLDKFVALNLLGVPFCLPPNFFPVVFIFISNYFKFTKIPF